MNIWILNHYAGGMLFDKGGRHYYFSKYLKRMGHEPIVFCCNAKHNSQFESYYKDESLWHEHMAEEIETPFVFIKGRTYIGNGKQRILNMVDFYHNVKKTGKQYAEIDGKPDVILASSVHPLTLVAGIQLAKKFGVKCICEIRDLWPESIVAYGVASKNNPLIKILYCLEKWIYTKAGAIIFTMEGGKDYIIEKGWDKNHGGPVDLNKVYHINNGVDLEEFEFNKENFQIDDPDLEDSNYFKVVYTGSIRATNHVEKIVEAADKIKNESHIKFLIWGDGDMKDNLIKIAEDNGLFNIVFKDAIKKSQVPYVLSRADICITDVCSDTLFRFGISPNKLFEYMASGTPVLSCMPCNYDVIEKYKIGLTIDGDNTDNIVTSIINIKTNGKAMYRKGLNNARAEFDFSNLTNKLTEVIKNV